MHKNTMSLWLFTPHSPSLSSISDLTTSSFTMMLEGAHFIYSIVS